MENSTLHISKKKKKDGRKSWKHQAQSSPLQTLAKHTTASTQGAAIEDKDPSSDKHMNKPLVVFHQAV